MRRAPHPCGPGAYAAVYRDHHDLVDQRGIGRRSQSSSTSTASCSMSSLSSLLLTGYTTTAAVVIGMHGFYFNAAAPGTRAHEDGR